MAKKRTKKTAAAQTATKKSPGAKASIKKKAGAKKTAGPAKSAGSAIGTTKKPVVPRAAAPKRATPIRGGGAKKTAAKSAKKSAEKTAATSSRPERAASKSPPVPAADPQIFVPFTEGERAEALRVLIEEPRLASMASVGRYRVIAVEPLAVKPPHGLSGHRLARVVVYDYASDRSVDACVNLDEGRVAHLNISRAQPMLAREEEAAAISIALGDERVKEQLSLGEEPQVAMHYWSRNDANLAFARRSAAVIFGRPDSSPSLIAVVDLLDNLVCEIIPATQW